jgi:hypothetical protein
MLCWVWLVMSWTAAASAAPGPAERETARSLMVEGDRLLDAGDVAAALQRYQTAHALMRVPTTGLAVARAQAQLGMLVEARGTALEVTSLEGASSEPAVFDGARRAAAALASSLEPRVCTLRTRVKPSSAQYSLQIDEVLLPEAARAVAFKTNPGLHRLRVRAPGFREQTRQVSLREGASEEVAFELVPEPTREQAPETPQQAAPVASELAIVQASAGQAAYSAPLDGKRDSGRVRGIVGLSIGGAALAAGMVTGVLSWTQAANIRQQHCAVDNGCDPGQRDALQRANTLGHVANIALPLGAIGIAYGLYELLTLPAAPLSAETSRLRLELAPDSVVLRGVL